MHSPITRLSILLFCLSAANAQADTPNDCKISATLKQYTKVIEHCYPPAKSGDLQAAFYLGEAYEYIQTPQRNGTRAAKWYMKAAEQGHLLAQRNLAALYDSGFGVPKNSWLSFRWYQRAAEQGQAHSQLMTGMMYLDGTGTLKDRKKGLYWLQQAAHSGEPNAQYMYGKTRYEENSADAVAWYKKSAKQGNSYALYRLGLLHFRGENLSQDYQLAMQYAEQALAKGHPRAEVLKRKILEVQPQLGKSQAKSHEVLETPGVAPATEVVKAVPSAQQDSEQKVSTPASAQISPTASNTEKQSEKNTEISSNKPAGSEPTKVAVATRNRKSTEADNPKLSVKTELSQPPLPGHADWLLSQPPTNFTIQLALMSQLDSIKRFFRWYGLENRAHYYRSEFNAGPMWVLTYGNYQTLKDAQNAIKQLPPKVQKMKPWVRQLESLQKSYKAVKSL
ncbi:MAG: SPOR domain-containing protein [Motiliproteus sp.]|nr:SPOR domain-containing protein [Motiliproteus sp.]MCW9051766.1 SPOR domain-containing protein [Motiliproteus sp.]